MIPDYLIPSQYARHIGRPYQTVHTAIIKGRIASVEVLGIRMVRSSEPWVDREITRDPIIKESVLHALEAHTEAEVARSFGVSRQYINQIKNGKR